MTDLSDDIIPLVRAAEVRAMDKEGKASYLRSRGWRRTKPNKQQRWQSPGGITATLAGAVQLQVLADQAVRKN
jgi:hypothetical protein